MTARPAESFEVDGRRRQAFSIGSSEHFALPRLWRAASTGDGMAAGAPLTDVGVYLAPTGLASLERACAEAGFHREPDRKEV